VDQEDSNAHDILLCVNTGDMKSTPIATDEESGKGFRFGFPNDQFFFKSQEEMGKVFHDLPESLDNTNEIVDKVDILELKRDIMLPNFPIPEEFKIHQGPESDKENQWEYLKELTFKGAKDRYVDISQEVEERLNFELFTIRTMGFAGYFLIVADFIRAGRDLGVFIGPGRGSAAGSVVAYCIGITNIDPIKYNLLFERFLNPDRKSMPDIDTDFDDAGRQKVIDYVVDKYGKNQVAQIITYGSMAAKSSIKDVARVLDLPLAESNMLAKLVPDRPGTNLVQVMTAPIETVKKEQNPEDFENIKTLRKILEDGKSLQADVLKEAMILEGSVRNVGVHAAGIIIAPYDLTDIIPVATSKESELLVTQFDGKVIEDAGVIKMDFLGLKTLTIIKDALRLIKQNHNVDIDIDYISLEDQKTFELYQRGDTNGTFQFESDGMQMYLRDLKPDKFEDLIAMNALYRPGPIEYIPKFISRKHGREAVSYDLMDMQEHLEETYGITVYQEQVMLLSQKLAGFSKGDADVLRKAMGKKQIEVLNKMKSQFMEGCNTNGHDPKVAEKVWTDWEAFAQYAFNKSHSTCYAFVAYQTAYLKANYPAEYMAAVLNNQNNIEKISFFMEECKKMGVPVLGPDINESELSFTVNKKGEIRFGMSGMKGVGEKAVESIVEERDANGLYASVYDFARRTNSRAVSKKVYENLVYGGAFDCFGFNRAQFFFKPDGGFYNGIERLVKYTNDFQNNLNSSQASLFGGTNDAEITEPQLPECEEWGLIEKLKYEKESIGIYLTGHPLDNYKFELENFCSHQVKHLSLLNRMKSTEALPEDQEDFKKISNRDLIIGGLVSASRHGTTKTGKPFGSFMFEDYGETFEIALFGEDYIKLKQYLVVGLFLQVRGIVQERFKQKDNWEFKVNSIVLLSELRDKMSKCLTIQLPLTELSETFMSKMDEIVKLNTLQNPQRNCQLKFMIMDFDGETALEMPSKSVKITPSNEFLEDISKLLGVRYKLN
jgi:DNA polymerase-3 subunit alpha